MKNKKIEIIEIFKWITSIHKYISIFANEKILLSVVVKLIIKDKVKKIGIKQKKMHAK